MERQTAASNEADRKERESSNIRTTEAQKEVARMRGPNAASARASHAQEKSDFWIEKKTGNVLSKAAAEAQLKPGEHLEDTWTNPTHEALKEHSNAMTAQARVKRSDSQNEVDEYRKKLMKVRVQTAQAKDPEGTEHLQDVMRDATTVINSKKASSEARANAERDLKWAQEKFAKAVGMEVPPEDHAWSILPQYFNYALEIGRGLHEAATGRGATANATGTPAGATPTTPPKPAGTTPTTGTRKGFNALINQFE